VSGPRHPHLNSKKISFSGSTSRTERCADPVANDSDQRCTGGGAKVPATGGVAAGCEVAPDDVVTVFGPGRFFFAAAFGGGATGSSRATTGFGSTVVVSLEYQCSRWVVTRTGMVCRT
jgi:hypothetical protein